MVHMSTRAFILESCIRPVCPLSSCETKKRRGHGLGFHQVAGLLIPAIPLQKEAILPHTILHQWRIACKLNIARTHTHTHTHTQTLHSTPAHAVLSCGEEHNYNAHNSHENKLQMAMQPSCNEMKHSTNQNTCTICWHKLLENTCTTSQNGCWACFR